MNARITVLVLLASACATTAPVVAVEKKNDRWAGEPSDAEKLQQVEKFVSSCELESARRVLNRVRYGGEEWREIVESMLELEATLPVEQPARARGWWAKAQPGPTAPAEHCVRKEIDRALAKVPNSPLYLMLAAVDDLRDFTEHSDATERLERAKAALEKLPATFEPDTGVSVAALKAKVERIIDANERWNEQGTTLAALKDALASGQLSPSDYQEEVSLAKDAERAAEAEWTQALAPFKQYASGPVERVEPKKALARSKKPARRR